MNIAYCARRLEKSLDLAHESTDSCARLAHESFARLYFDQLMALCHATDIDDGSLLLEQSKKASLRHGI